MVTSTRKKLTKSIVDAILDGLSKDRGLYTFETINSTFFNKELLDTTYTQLTHKVFSELLDEYTSEELTDIINNSYNATNFNPDIITTKILDDHTYIELYRGNTFAFKDMALSILPNLFETAKKKRNITKKTIILTATSGDTGSAALDGFSTLEDTYVIVLYPHNGVSEFQEKQMLSYQSDNFKIIAVEGNFDDCQNIVKNIFSQTEVKNVLLSSANSINIGRIVPQIVYYIYTYNELVKANKVVYGDKINITVPSGNFGNIFAAYLAKKLGLPVNKLIIASNQNDVLTDLFNKGIYNTNRPLTLTMSPSMDILISSNFERYLYYLVNGDTAKVNSYMDELISKKTITINELHQQSDFVAYRTSEEETLEEIKNVFTKDNYVIDPHTAVARNVLRKYKEDTNDTTYSIIASTASPFKFIDSINKALGLENNADLQTKITNLSAYGNIEIDNRIKDVLTKNVDDLRIIKSTDDTITFIEKFIGEKDD